MCQLLSLIPTELDASDCALPSLPPGWLLPLTLVRHEVSPCPTKPSNPGAEIRLTHATTVTAPVMLNGAPGISTWPEAPSNAAAVDPPKKSLVAPATPSANVPV